MSYKQRGKVFHLIDLGRFTHAIRELAEMLAEDPNDGDLLYLMGYCHYRLDQHQEALVCCQDAISRGAGLKDCHYLLGNIYTELKKYTDSEEHFLAALREDPQCAEAMSAYSLLMLKTGYEQKAEKLLQEALTLDPNNKSVLNDCFRYYLARDKREAQAGVLGEIMRTSNSEVTKLVNIGLYELVWGNYKAARESFRQAFLLDPSNEGLLHILEDLDKNLHPLFWPINLVEKLGGPAVLWISFMIAFFALRLLKLSMVAVPLAVAYLVLCVYSWTVNPMYRIFVQRRLFNG
jgi:tetratricopeptide (TPR) repeat protein